VRTPWKPTSIFQDSLSCLTFGEPERVHPCSECLLIDFVPPQEREAEVPCHHIPLNVLGETMDSVNRYDNQQEFAGPRSSGSRRSAPPADPPPSKFPFARRTVTSRFGINRPLASEAPKPACPAHIERCPRQEPHKSLLNVTLITDLLASLRQKGGYLALISVVRRTVYLRVYPGNFT
jgi:hypothetical protein